MTIKQGYDNKPTHINIYADPDNRVAEFNIDQEGLIKVIHGKEVTYEQEKYGYSFDKQDVTTVGSVETLAYISLDELLTLRDEINKVVRDMCGL